MIAFIMKAAIRGAGAQISARDLISAAGLLPTAAAVGGMVAALVAARRGRRLWLAVWAWYLLTLAPVLGIVQVGRQAMADRYTYLPSFGPFLAVAVALSWGWGRTERLRKGRLVAQGALAAALAALLLALSLSALRQAAIWNGSIRLWSAAIERTLRPQASLFYNRAVAYQEDGRSVEAIADYDRAIALEPDDERYWLNRALAYLQVRRFDMAVADFKAACRLGDDFSCKVIPLYVPGASSAGGRAP